MPEAYGNEELRLISEKTIASAADAVTVQVGPVPEGKIWTLLAIAYRPSVNETQTVSFYKVSRYGNQFGIFNPLSLTLQPAYATPIEAGYVLQLFPGEYLVARRSAATAGSTMGINVQYVESDLPLYDYVEPQEAAREKRFVTSVRRVMAAGGGARAGGESAAGRTSGRTGPLPKKWDSNQPSRRSKGTIRRYPVQ